jgi:hypothetical protein
MLALSKAYNTVGISLPTPEDGNRTTFRKAVLSSVSSPVLWTKSRTLAILSYNIVRTLSILRNKNTENKLRSIII